VKLTFAKGAALKDSSRLFNSSLEGNTRRAIDFHKGDKINEKAFKALIRAAAALNTSRAAGRRGQMIECELGAAEIFHRIDRDRSFADLEMQLRRRNVAGLPCPRDHLSALDGVAALDQQCAGIGIG